MGNFDNEEEQHFSPLYKEGQTRLLKHAHTFYIILLNFFSIEKTQSPINALCVKYYNITIGQN